MATITLHNANRNQAEAVEKGLNVAICKVSLSATLSVGDVHIIGKLPHGAIPVDAILYAGTAFTDASTGAVMKFGTSASQELFYASATYSSDLDNTLLRTTRPLGTQQQISLSDDAMPRFENLVMVAGAGVSVGHICDLIVYYKLPGQTL